MIAEQDRAKMSELRAEGCVDKGLIFHVEIFAQDFYRGSDGELFAKKDSSRNPESSLIGYVGPVVEMDDESLTIAFGYNIRNGRAFFGSPRLKIYGGAVHDYNVSAPGTTAWCKGHV